MADVANFYEKKEYRSDLKKCPFCGNRAVITLKEIVGFRVCCEACGNGTLWGYNKELAVKSWNRRIK